MGAAEDFDQHLDGCDKCIETSPGQWDLCDTGQALLVLVPNADLPKTRVGPK